MFKRNPLLSLGVFVAAISFVLAGSADAVQNPVKVFIMAGQSNMEGHGRVETGNGNVAGGIGSLRYQVNNDPSHYGHLVDGSNNWKTRSDVWISSTTDSGEKGNLSVGFGVVDRIGPELGFGNVIGDLYDEQVLLIKTAWGGKSLAVDFRPPTAVADRGGSVGFYYNEIINTYNNVVNNIATEFPDYNGQGVELVGLGWHQGWNDRVNQTRNDEYEENMADFIVDIRNSLGDPDLPFVIAETGMSGHSETHPRALSLMAAQEAIVDFNKYPEFEGNVGFVGTKDYWRVVGDSPNSQSYHWNGNGETYYLIGEGMGNSMAGLVATSVPEPTSLALLVIGSLALASRRRR